jgi:DNA repair photolyase
LFYSGLVRRVEYVAIQCKSALNRVEGMPFRWSVNPYVGCRHACRYCYARAYYVKAERGDGGEDFESRIFVKVNLPAVLRRELARPSWAGETVALGTATDVYQPAEGRFRLTRRVLEALLERRTPVSLVTKSPLVYRDRELLAALARQAEVRVYFSITTLDEAVWREIEPGTARPARRLWALERLVAAGVPAGVLLAPILPGITDSTASLAAVAEAAAAHGAAFFGTSTLRLGPVVREQYFEFVQEYRPELLGRYRRAYRAMYVKPDYQAALEARVQRVRTRFGLAAEPFRGRPGLAPAEPRAARPGAGRSRQPGLPLAL